MYTKRAIGSPVPILIALVLALSGGLCLAASATAYSSSIWINTNNFTLKSPLDPGCVKSSIPARNQARATKLFTWLGYGTPYVKSGASFTKTAFLNRVFVDNAVYVHSHGDKWGSQAMFRADPGVSTDCRDGLPITGTEIAAHTLGSPYNLVIMSTCKLGAPDIWNNIPDAFGISKVNFDNEGTGSPPRVLSTEHEFYLGYRYYTYNTESAAFEDNFVSYLYGYPDHSVSLYWAYTDAWNARKYAAAPEGGHIWPFTPMWYGNPYYNGLPAAH